MERDEMMGMIVFQRVKPVTENLPQPQIATKRLRIALAFHCFIQCDAKTLGCSNKSTQQQKQYKTLTTDSIHKSTHFSGSFISDPEGFFNLATDSTLDSTTGSIGSGGSDLRPRSFIAASLISLIDIAARRLHSRLGGSAGLLGVFTPHGFGSDSGTFRAFLSNGAGECGCFFDLSEAGGGDLAASISARYGTVRRAPECRTLVSPCSRAFEHHCRDVAK
ncbi:ATP synthase gamma chain [Striga asiatica]|uniref:ATP synthase gamma chain n=1 Tax=Striga asiatica TaxID=4170 RepID=A0A5A7NWT8_STRAF|nr:ATP synthase gamma chain [Striga asiatica]